MTAGTHVTLATSTGPIWLALLLHVMGGAVGLVSGFAAVMVAKGGAWHRRTGLVFVAAMMVMAFFGAIVGTYEMRQTAVGALFAGYLVFTGMTTVRPVLGTNRAQHVALMVLALLVALFHFIMGSIVLRLPGRAINGVPAGMILFMGTIALLAGIGDWRMIRAGGLQGTRKIARHLWRMCFSLFIASGSFFLGQMKFIPERMRSLPLLFALALSPLIVLLYWMWRIRLRNSLRGLTIARAHQPQAISGQPTAIS